jgi:hypothetical protein
LADVRKFFPLRGVMTSSTFSERAEWKNAAGAGVRDQKQSLSRNQLFDLALRFEIGL